MDGGMRKSEKHHLSGCSKSGQAGVCEIIKHTPRHGTAVRHITHTTQITRTHTHPPAVYKHTRKTWR